MKRGGLKHLELKNQLPTKNDDWDSSRNLLAGAAEALYKCPGSGVASEPRPSLFSAESTPTSIIPRTLINREGLGSEASSGRIQDCG